MEMQRKRSEKCKLGVVLSSSQKTLCFCHSFMMHPENKVREWPLYKPRHLIGGAEKKPPVIQNGLSYTGFEPLGIKDITRQLNGLSIRRTFKSKAIQELQISLKMEQNVEPQNGRRVINLLECPACRHTMAPPIYLCEDGHNVCSRCRGNLPRCPTCSKPVLEERNKLAERLAEQLPYPCANQDMGCKEKLLLRDMETHEEVCPHRLYRCIPCQPRCRWRGRRFQVLEHMKDEHKELVWVKSYNSLVYENFDIHTDYKCTHILSCLKEIFWCHSKRDTKQGKLYEAVQFIGRKEKAANYEYEFEFYARGNNRTAVFKNTVQCEDSEVEKIYSSGDCLILDLKLLQHFVTDDKKLYYNFKLFRAPKTEV